MKSKVLVIVVGGVADWACSDNENVEVDVLDLDNIGAGDPVELTADFLTAFGHLDAVKDALQIERENQEAA
jgi:hypothetical protein